MIIILPDKEEKNFYKSRKFEKNIKRYKQQPRPFLYKRKK